MGTFSTQQVAQILAEDDHDYEHVLATMQFRANGGNSFFVVENDSVYDEEFTEAEVNSIVEYFDEYCTCPACAPAETSFTGTCHRP